ncbi:MAG: NAD-dependent epimerase/dehydratase family protein [Promethearchaeota archaeon]
MKILITGSNGFIGRNLQRSLENRKHEVIGIDIIKGDNKCCDLRKLKEVESLFKEISPEIIVHLAAISSSDLSRTKVISTQEVNFMGTVNLLECAQRMDSELDFFILASTAEVYGGLDKKMYDENDLPQPLSPYAASKAAAESFALMKSRITGLKTCCIRFCNAFGRRNNDKFVIEYIINCFIRKIPPTIKTPNSVREFMYLPDHLSVYETIINKQPTGIINASSGESYSILDLTLMIKEVTNSEIPIVTEKDSQTTSIILNNEKLRNLGFIPKYSLRNAISHFYDDLINTNN